MTKVVEIRYVGAHDEVVLPGLGVTVKRGGTVQVSAEVAAGYLDQAVNWQPAPVGEEG